jgi:hypothetical protein
MQLPSITTGNVPMLILGCERSAAGDPADEVPKAYAHFFHNEPRIETANLGNDSHQFQLALWLPMPRGVSPRRTLTLCWSTKIEFGGTYTKPTFEVIVGGRPSRPTLSTTKFSSNAYQSASLMAAEVVGVPVANNALTLTELSGIADGEAGFLRGTDAICMLQIKLPAKQGFDVIGPLRFTLFGMAVDQW